MRNPGSILTRGLVTSTFCAMYLLGIAACGGGSPAGDAAAKLTYPDSRRSEQIDVYHGEKVPDPYRWLEDPASPETKAWVEAQNKLTFGFLEQIPQRAAIKERLTELWGLRAFRNTGQAWRSVFLYSQRRLAESGRTLRCGFARRGAACLA